MTSRIDTFVPSVPLIPAYSAPSTVIRDYMSCETVTGEGGWMDRVLVLDGPCIKDGSIQVSGKPGLGITLNPDASKHISR
jgi:L-alanine-DL-glutamate epimerase-like enolase superfamily enzyme